MAESDVAFVSVRLRAGNPSNQVWSVDVEDVDRGCDQATIVMGDLGSLNSDALQEGIPVSVEMGWASQHALIFEGRIHSVRPVAKDDPRVTAVAYDHSYRMQQTPPDGTTLPRQHVGTLKEIVESIVQRYEIPIGGFALDPMPRYTEERPLLQGTMSDWEFIQFLAEEHRARAYVEVNGSASDSKEVLQQGGQSKFYFASEAALLAQSPMGTLHYCPGHGSLVEFSYQRVASGSAPSSFGTVTDPKTGEPATQAGPEPASGPQLAVSPERRARAQALMGEGAARNHERAVQSGAESVAVKELRARRELHGLPSDPDLAARLVQQDPTRVLGLSGTGKARGTVFLRAKGCVEIEGLASWAAGRWYVHRVNHICQRGSVGNESRFTYRTTFEATR